MTANINPETNVPYGIISANSLDPDLVNELQMHGTDVYYEDAVKEAKRELVNSTEVQLAVGEWVGECYGKHYPSLNDDEQQEFRQRYVEDHWDSVFEQRFNDSYDSDEPVHEGTYEVPGYGPIQWRTTWIGGALNVFIFKSPFVTEKAVQCSPCVPNAGNLDQEGEGDYQCYDVPADWLTEEARTEREERRKVRPDKFVIEIELGNAAFEDGSLREVARILRELASKLEYVGDQHMWQSYLHDFNGNRVGQARTE